MKFQQKILELTSWRLWAMKLGTHVFQIIILEYNVAIFDIVGPMTSGRILIYALVPYLVPTPSYGQLKFEIYIFNYITRKTNFKYSYISKPCFLRYAHLSWDKDIFFSELKYEVKAWSKNHTFSLMKSVGLIVFVLNESPRRGLSLLWA